VRYDAVNAMLLNEFLKEHRKVEQLEKQVEALTAGLQKVSAQLELSKPAPHPGLNNHQTLATLKYWEKLLAMSRKPDSAWPGSPRSTIVAAQSG
jgi:hypothetical protein